MKQIILFALVISLALSGYSQDVSGTAEQRQSLDHATAVLRDAFKKGDIALITQLHHPSIVKYFGGKNVITGRDELQKGLTDWLKTVSIEFVENTVESTVFNGTTAIQTVVFAIRSTPKAGGEPTVGRGRSMVVYVQDKTSPTGWLSLREIAQEAPPKP